jgi:hypothetical protein
MVEGRKGKIIGLLSAYTIHTACFWLYRVPVLYFKMTHLVSTGKKDAVR